MIFELVKLLIPRSSTKIGSAPVVPLANARKRCRINTDFPHPPVPHMITDLRRGMASTKSSSLIVLPPLDKYVGTYIVSMGMDSSRLIRVRMFEHREIVAS